MNFVEPRQPQNILQHEYEEKYKNVTALRQLYSKSDRNESTWHVSLVYIYTDFVTETSYLHKEAFPAHRIIHPIIRTQKISSRRLQVHTPHIQPT